MRTRRPIVIGIGVACVALIAVGVYLFSTDRFGIFTDNAEKLQKAPGFSLPDAGGALIDLEDIDADVTVINFWASWSPYAGDELTSLIKLKEEYGSRIVIVGLNRDHNAREGQVFLESLSLGETLTFVYDRDDAYYREVKGYAMPETIFLNDKKEIVAHVRKPMSYDEMKTQVDVVLE